MGGMIRAIETGFAQREIQNSAYEQQRSFESEERVVVGVNRFTSGEEPSLELLKINPDVEQRQIQQLGDLKKKRSAGKVRDALRCVKEAAESSDNPCLRFWRPSGPMPRSGRFRMRCVRFWGNIRSQLEFKAREDGYLL